MVLADQGYGSGEQAAGIPLEFEPCMCVCILDRGGVARVGRDSSSVRVAERKKENRQPKRGIGEEDRVHTLHLHEQDFGRTIRGTGGALLLLTRGTTGSQRDARWNPNSTGGLISV